MVVFGGLFPTCMLKGVPPCECGFSLVETAPGSRHCNIYSVIRTSVHMNLITKTSLPKM